MSKHGRRRRGTAPEMREDIEIEQLIHTGGIDSVEPLIKQAEVALRASGSFNRPFGGEVSQMASAL